MGIGGITLSTSLVTLFNAVTLGVLISKKINLNYGELFKNLFKMIAAGTITLAVCWIASVLFNEYVMMSKVPFQLLKIFVIGILCLVVYTALNLAFKMAYAKELFKRLTSKLAK